MTPITVRESIWERESWLLFLEGRTEDLLKKLLEKFIEN